MRKSRYTEGQVAFALTQAEVGTPVAEVCRKLGVSEATFFLYVQAETARTDLTEFCGRMRSRLKQASFVEKQTILRLLAERIIVGDGRLVIRHVIPLRPPQPSGSGLSAPPERLRLDGVDRAALGRYLRPESREANIMFYFHIGAHKTGTTTIQRFFVQHKEVIEKAGLEYPDVGRELNGHHRLASTFRREMAPDGPPSDVLKELQGYASGRPTARVLLSSENFEDLSEPAIRRLIEAVHPHSAHVLFYVRDFTRLLPSRYAQKTKIGANLDDFDTFFDRSRATHQVQAFDIAERWARMTCRWSVRVRALDQRSLHKNGLIADVLEGVGLNPEIITKCSPGIRELAANQSPHWIAIEAVRAIGTHMVAAGRRWRPGIYLGDRSTTPEKADRSRAGLGQLVQACERGVEAAGLSEQPAQYLTPEQFWELSRCYQQNIENFTAAGYAPRLPDAAVVPPTARTFMPSLGILSTSKRRRLRDAIAETRAFQKLNSPLADVILGAIWSSSSVGPRQFTVSIARRPVT